jgi:hypothetical protein
VGLSTVEIRIPDAQQACNNRDVLLKRSSAEMRIHSMGSLKERMEILESDVDGDAQTDSRPDRVTASNPALEAKHILSVDTELSDFGLVGGEGNEVLGDIALSFSLLQEPSFGRISVGCCLGCSEGLGSDQEESCLWVGIAESLSQVRAIDVGHEMESLFAITVVLESFSDHNRAPILVSINL